MRAERERVNENGRKKKERSSWVEGGLVCIRVLLLTWDQLSLPPLFPPSIVLSPSFSLSLSLVLSPGVPWVTCRVVASLRGRWREGKSSPGMLHFSRTPLQAAWTQGWSFSGWVSSFSLLFSLFCYIHQRNPIESYRVPRTFPSKPWPVSTI